VLAFLLVYFFVEETARKGLEDLEKIFSIEKRRFATRNARQAKWWFKYKFGKAKLADRPANLVVDDSKKEGVKLVTEGTEQQNEVGAERGTSRVRSSPIGGDEVERSGRTEE
jgi:hypothetical protein